MFKVQSMDNDFKSEVSELKKQIEERNTFSEAMKVQVKFFFKF